MKTCKVCRAKFTPARPLQTTCSIPCALEWGKKQLAKKQAKETREEKAKDKAKREKLKTRSDWIKEAQIAFNKFIRLRDNGKPCISCGVPLSLGGVGGGFDAGHFRSVGSAPHLRFDERNCHGQCKQCNWWGHGRHAEYRIGLFHRLGVKVRRQLEADQTPRKWTVDELKAIRDLYRNKAKQLEQEQANGIRAGQHDRETAAHCC